MNIHISISYPKSIIKKSLNPCRHLFYINHFPYPKKISFFFLIQVFYRLIWSFIHNRHLSSTLTALYWNSMYWKIIQLKLHVQYLFTLDTYLNFRFMEIVWTLRRGLTSLEGSGLVVWGVIVTWIGVNLRMDFRVP